jgi:hypothetical protein
MPDEFCTVVSISGVLTIRVNARARMHVIG